MKTPNEIKSWVDMLLSRRPNVEDKNYLEAIKFYMDKVDRPTGHWIVDKEHSITMTFYKCTNCDWFGGVTWYKFCPICGADMRNKEAHNE